jgi:MFS transporter, putative metabolite:H+ symporter
LLGWLPSFSSLSRSLALRGGTAIWTIDPVQTIIATTGGIRAASDRPAPCCVGLEKNMAVLASEDLLTVFDNAPLNRRYWIIFALLAAVFAFDFFDFLVVGYLLAAVAREWHLTYGQSAVILYSGGIGAIIGAVIFGALADAFGRKQQIVIGTVLCALSAGLIAFLPDGAWIAFATLRFFVGIGLAAAVTPATTVIVELTPTRYRTMATSFYLVFLSAGGLLAPVGSALMMGIYGWRGVALLSFIALIIAILVWLFTPESVRWLVAKGRLAEARAEVARHLGWPLDRVPLASTKPVAPPRANLLDLLSQPRMFCETILIWGGSSIALYGVFLWGPTIVALLLGVPVPKAAAYFVFVSSAGVIGKIIVTLVAPRIGRRPLGVIGGFIAAAALALAGYYNTSIVDGLPLMVILLCVANFGIEGGFSNLVPYTVESYGVSLGARASGLGQAANGVGKIVGPLSLALVAGTSQLVTPQQTAAAVLPTFLFLACCMVPVALSFLLLGVETNGKAIVLDHGNTI